MSETDIKKLEKMVLHRFRNRELLEQALTHSSIRNTDKKNYERLEFLGDRVLGLAIAEMLCHLFPNATEGELSVRLNGLVNAEVCAQIATEIGLPDIIHMGAEMKLLEERRLGNIYADVVEALIAVMYLEAGIEAVQPFIYRYWEQRMRKSESRRRDAKTELQEWAHRQGGVQPVYRVLKRKGPDHDPVFEVEVKVTGFGTACGEGQSKRQAEQAAAAEILCREGVWIQEDGDRI